MDVSERLGDVAIFAGGTGGHVYPALAVAFELDRRGYAVHWFGTERGLESRVVPEAGFTLHCLKVRGTCRRSPPDCRGLRQFFWRCCRPWPPLAETDRWWLSAWEATLPGQRALPPGYCGFRW